MAWWNDTPKILIVKRAKHLLKPRFTDPIETYTVLVLRLDEYIETQRDLPPGFDFLPLEKRSSIRAQEHALLKQLFDDWQIPYNGKLRGLRDDSAVFVMYGDELAGGVYVCDQNEFDDDPMHGQLHYVFTNPKYRGYGIYSMMVHESIQRMWNWGLREMFFNTDRYLLPNLHLRWGFKIWKEIPKPSRLPQNGVGRLMRAFLPFLRQMRKWLHF